MERLFSVSALGHREKWTGRPDYRKRTIDEAIKDCSRVYEPRPKPKAAPSPNGQSEHVGGKTSNIPEIIITELEADVNDQAVKALANHPGIYQRNLNLVSVAFHIKANQSGKDKIDRA